MDIVLSVFSDIRSETSMFIITGTLEDLEVTRGEFLGVTL
jgi:hypothetical protein